MFDNIRALDLYVDHTNRPAVAAKMISAEGEVKRIFLSYFYYIIIITLHYIITFRFIL